MRSFLIIVLIVVSGIAKAQNYPVQAFLQVTPPYSGYLPDYSDPFNQQMKVLLTLNDFSVPSYNVKLQFSFNGNGYSLQNPDYLASPTYTLYPGVPLEISGADLAHYLSLSNLQVSGLNVQDYQNRKILPEGPLTVCVKILDANLPVATNLANPACNQIWVSLYDPPLLNTPMCGQEVSVLNPQFMTFTWMPLHMNAPGASTNTEYTFELFEIRPDGNDPNIVVNQTLPIYTTTTTQTVLTYGITEPPLQENMSYVWRVKASDLNGRDHFNNQGYSQVCTFTYGNMAANTLAGISLNLSAHATGNRQGHASWTSNNVFTNYTLEVRKTGNPNYAWFPHNTTGASFGIHGLEPESEYECRVRGEAQGEYSDWSNTAVFTTHATPEYSCGSTTMPPTDPNAAPLLSAQPYQVYQIGQFELMVTSISPSQTHPGSGWYQGTGKVSIPFALTSLNVSFDAIYVDEHLMVVNGELHAITDGVQNWIQEQSMIDPLEYTVPGIIESAGVNNDSMAYVVVDGDTITFPFPNPYDPIIVNDDSDYEYVIFPDGTVIIRLAHEASDDTLAATERWHVDFFKSDAQVYGFDSMQFNVWSEHYEHIFNDSFIYHVPWKSLARGAGDIVKARFIDLDNVDCPISFETAAGNSIQASQSGDDYTLQLPAVENDFAIYALCNGERIGKLNVALYKGRQKNIHIVPLAANLSIDTSTVRDAITSIYNQGAGKISLYLEDPFTDQAWDLNADNKLAAGNHSNLVDYSAEMRALNQAYLAHNTALKASDYIVFIIPSFDENNVDVGGYMPLGRHKGYVQSQSTPAQTAHVLAHEIGHGCYGLEHTFPEVSQGETGNLMDYGNEHHLTKMQWDEMDRLLPDFNLFVDNEDAFYRASIDYRCINRIAALNLGVNSFKDIKGAKIQLHGGYWARSFVGPNDVALNHIGGVAAIASPTGDLYYPSKLNDKFPGYYRVNVEGRLLLDVPLPEVAYSNDETVESYIMHFTDGFTTSFGDEVPAEFQLKDENNVIVKSGTGIIPCFNQDSTSTWEFTEMKILEFSGPGVPETPEEGFAYFSLNMLPFKPNSNVMLYMDNRKKVVVRIVSYDGHQYIPVTDGNRFVGYFNKDSLMLKNDDDSYKFLQDDGITIHPMVEQRILDFQCPDLDYNVAPGEEVLFYTLDLTNDFTDLSEPSGIQKSVWYNNPGIASITNPKFIPSTNSFYNRSFELSGDYDIRGYSAVPLYYAAKDRLYLELLYQPTDPVRWAIEFLEKYLSNRGLENHFYSTNHDLEYEQIMEVAYFMSQQTPTYLSDLDEWYWYYTRAIENLKDMNTTNIIIDIIQLVIPDILESFVEEYELEDGIVTLDMVPAGMRDRLIEHIQNEFFRFYIIHDPTELIQSPTECKYFNRLVPRDPPSWMSQAFVPLSSNELAGMHLWETTEYDVTYSDPGGILKYKEIYKRHEHFMEAYNDALQDLVYVSYEDVCDFLDGRPRHELKALNLDVRKDVIIAMITQLDDNFSCNGEESMLDILSTTPDEHLEELYDWLVTHKMGNGQYVWHEINNGFSDTYGVERYSLLANQFMRMFFAAHDQADIEAQLDNPNLVVFNFHEGRYYHRGKQVEVNPRYWGNLYGNSYGGVLNEDFFVGVEKINQQVTYSNWAHEVGILILHDDEGNVEKHVVPVYYMNYLAEVDNHNDNVAAIDLVINAVSFAIPILQLAKAVTLTQKLLLVGEATFAGGQTAVVALKSNGYLSTNEAAEIQALLGIGELLSFGIGGIGNFNSLLSTQGPKTYAKMAENWQQVKQLPPYSFTNVKTFRDKLRAALRLTDDGTTSWIDNLSGQGWNINKRNALKADLQANPNLFANLDEFDGVGAWKVLDDLGVDAALRKDPSWLNRVSSWTDEGLEIASEGRILKNGNEVCRIVGDRLHVKYTGYGDDIVCDATKTTTGIGKYDPPGGVGTKQIIDSKLSKSGENPGGVNILNDTRNTQGWSDQKIWDEINQPWLDDAIARGDNIRAVSDPLDVNNVFKATDNIPSSVLSSPENLANYLKNLNDPNIIKDLSFYGREIRHLYQNNYLFDLASKTFVK